MKRNATRNHEQSQRFTLSSSECLQGHERSSRGEALRYTLLIITLSLLPNFILGLIRYHCKDQIIPFSININNSRIIPDYAYSRHFETIAKYQIQDMSKDTLFDKKKITRTRDNYGFSNYTYNQHPKILFIGDSYFDDPHLSADSGMQAKCDHFFGSNVSYNLGAMDCSGFKVYNELTDDGYITQPKKIILEVVERNLSAWLDLRTGLVDHLKKTKKYNYFGLDLLLGNNYKYLSESKLFKSPILAKYGTPHTINNTPVYFFRDGIYKRSDAEIDSLIANMTFTQNYFKQKGIPLYFVIVPDKESMYPSLFTSSYLPTYQDSMRAHGLNIIDIYTELIKTPQQYYYNGDTHWNNNALNKFFEVLVLRKVISKVDNSSFR